MKGSLKYTVSTFLVFLTCLSCGGGGGGGGSTSTTTLNPKVLSTSPSADETEVDITKITVTFDSAMDSSTLNTTTFTISYPSGTVSGMVSYDSTTNTATFIPTYFFTPLTTFTATLTTGVKDVKGNPINSQYSWSFTTVTGFIAKDLTTEKYYAIEATKVAEGTYCYIYLEKGQTVSQATIDAIKNEFDTKIYPYVTSSIGSEPNPGIDGKSKLYILLLDINDGYDPNSSSGYTAGYFSQGNEYSQNDNTFTNLKEMIYMDLYPSKPDSSDFYNTLAHEFQHMIHWEQKTRKMNLTDDTWLDEAISEIAPTYCGYGPSYNRVKTFEEAPSNSLTKWDSAVEDYGVVYMWAQYYKDRVGSNIFYKMLHNNKTGIDSVNAALTEIGYSKDFTGTFRDWAVANFSGNTISWSGYPERSYSSIDTWPATYNGIILPGLFGSSTKWNVSILQTLDKWSVDYYYFYTILSSIGLGSVKWSPASSSDKAAFVDWGNSTLYYSLTAGTSYSYYTYGYLISQNPSEISGGGDSIIYSKPTLNIPKEILDEANKNPIIKKLAEETGKPQPVCIHSYFTEKEKESRAKGARPPF